MTSSRLLRCATCAAQRVAQFAQWLVDVSCPNRPFDDQSQLRIRIESDAVTEILENCDKGEWESVSAEIAQIEIRAMPDVARRAKVTLLLPEEKDILSLTAKLFDRAG